VLVAISATSVILVNQAREDNTWVVHTVEVENQISTLLLQIRTAESAARISADLGAALSCRARSRDCEHPSGYRQADEARRRQSNSDREQQKIARAGPGAAR
jgi:hypothetical protein